MKKLSKKLAIAICLLTAACGGATDGETRFAPEASLSTDTNSQYEMKIIDVPEGSETISTPKSVLTAYTIGFNYSADDSEAFFFAVESINEFYGFDILKVVEFNQADIQVTRDDIEGAKMGLAYVYDGPACNVILDYEAVDQWKIVSHEILHCLGFGHSDAWESIMHPNNGNGDFTHQMLTLWENTLEENHIEATEAKTMGYQHDDDDNMEAIAYED